MNTPKDQERIHVQAMSESKVILVTGANTGLGLEIVKALCRSSHKYTILVGSRTPSKGEDAIAEVKKEYPSTSSTMTCVQVDLESDETIEKAMDTISKGYGHLDVLLNNGGQGFDGQIASGKLSIREAFNISWDVNVTGTQVLTTLAIPLLLKSTDPRLIFMTSGTASLSDPERLDHEVFQRLNSSPPAGWPKNAGLNPITSYRSTKTGLNMLMREWAKTLKNDGVKIWCISPGFLATGLGGVGTEQLKKVSTVKLLDFATY